MFAVGTNISVKTRTPNPMTSSFPQVGAIRRDLDVVRRDNNEDSVPGELYNVDGFHRQVSIDDSCAGGTH